MSEFFDAIEKGKQVGQIIGGNIIPEDLLEKAKYLRRIGTPGNYRYIYHESKRRLKRPVSSLEKKDYRNQISTENLFYDDDKGWDKERVRTVHDPIIDKYLKKMKPSEKPVAYLMMGASGAGKGTILDYLKSEGTMPNDFPVVDPDEIKTKDWALGKDFNGYSEFDQKKASQLVHNEGSYLANSIIKKGIKMKSNLIIDKTFNEYNSLQKMVKRLKNKGYEVHVVMAYQTLERGIQNIKERAERTGRDVPTEFAEKAYKNIGPTSEKFVKNLPQGVTFTQYHSVEYGKPPVFCYSKEGDKTTGVLKTKL